ncbi:MAG: hypothetical protein KGL59_07040 [Acidobacteriota bacterium]|nr:hypothetical protein [Acidobacteriota bacterium]
MKPIRNATLGLAVALFATAGVIGCSNSAQNQPGSNFAQGSDSSSASASTAPKKDFTRRASRSASPSDSSSSSQAADNSAPQPVAITIPRGTELRVSVDQTLSSANAQSGEGFDATLLSPVRADGQTVIPSNARIRGQVVNARASGRLSGTADLAVTLVSVEINHQQYNIQTDTLARSGEKHKKRDIIAIGGGSALGAIIGGIAGGGKGAAIGAAAGAGAGTAGAAATGKKNVSLPAETTLIFHLAAPLRVQQ